MNNIANYYNVNRDSSPIFVNENTVAFLSNESGLNQIHLLDLASGEAKQLTYLENRVMSLFWTVTGDLLYFASDEGGNEQGQIYTVSVITGEIKNLTNNPKSRFSFGGVRNGGKELIVSSTARNSAHYDICRINTETGQCEIIVENNDNYNVPSVLSDNGKYLIYIKMKGSSKNYMYLLNLETLETERVHPDGEFASYGSPAFTKDSKGFYLSTDVDSDFFYVAYYDIADKTLTRVYEENWDIGGVKLSPDNKYLVMSVNEEGYVRHKILNLQNNSLENVIEPPKGINAGASFGVSGNRFLFSHMSGKQPSNIWYYDIDASEMKRLTVTKFSGISSDDLVEPSLHRYSSFDDLSVPYWMYKKPGTPVSAPFAVEIHGGPEGQSRPSFSPLTSYLVNEGFIVIVPNVRGSIGYGKRYHHLDDVEKRLDSVKDIECLLKHLRQTGFTGKAAVMGGSYGGYMTLASIAFYPGLFDAAVDTVGMSNLETFLENTAEYRRAHRESEYGSLKEHRHILRRVSPIHKVSEIITPLMVIHGKNDPRVPVTEAEQIVASLRERDVFVEYLCYDDEGHGLSKRKNQLDCYPKVAAFLKRHLSKD